MSSVIRNLLLAGAVVVGTFSVMGQSAQASQFGFGGDGLSFELGDTGIEVDVEDVVSGDWDDEYGFDDDDDDDDDDCVEAGPVEICDE
jgi:hypothetical protein